MRIDEDQLQLPHWDLSGIFPRLDSEEFRQAIQHVEECVYKLETFTDGYNLGSPDLGPVASGYGSSNASDIMTGFLEQMNTVLADYGTVRNYIYSFSTTDSYNVAAKRLLSTTDPLGVRIRQLEVRFRCWLGSLAAKPVALEKMLKSNVTIGQHAFFLKESAEQSHYLMSAAEESLAAELNVSGATAWSRLQDTICSQLKAPFSRNGEPEDLPVTVIRTFLTDPDPALRQQAYEVELQAWESVREPLAACLNGIKGAVSTLDRRRGRIDALHQTLDQARIDREILDALLKAMKESFPSFRRYWLKKAAYLGKEQLPWWDLFAPVGRSDRRFSYIEAKEFILNQFANFSDKLVRFSERAFEEKWIDAEPRAGKSGGGFCMYIPGPEESRILVNFDGSMDLVLTIAHELGHAYHNECLRGKSQLQRRTPMTMAETASIFNQTIITDAVLVRANDVEEELAILEAFLIDSAQIVVDIYSRYLFESELFERRSEAELSADELCELMLRCQQETYGTGLDQRYLNEYMWTWKPHYYNHDRSFYNFPYTFGLLFGLGLYKRFQQDSAGFPEQYDDLLADTGNGTASDLAARFGIDLRQPDFWRSGFKVIEERIERYTTLL